MTPEAIRAAVEALELARVAIEPLTGEQIRLHGISRDTASKIDAALSLLRAAGEERGEPVAWLDHNHAAANIGEFPWMLMVNQDHPLVKAKTERIDLYACPVAIDARPLRMLALELDGVLADVSHRGLSSFDEVCQQTVQSVRDSLHQLAASPGEVQVDARRLDWLGSQEGVNLVSDDAGRWAVSDMGMQPVPPEGGFDEMVGITSMVMPNEWHPNIRAALDAAIQGEGEETEQPNVHLALPSGTARNGDEQ